ncbi:MAG: iron ABC transporter permease [Planctomycetes bacterium]|nr:iron ABC transporter permease [Planctomycetota bacterium]MCC7397477.1 iron ABC transporter permease [Planctomycetota bacterium]
MIARRGSIPVLAVLLAVVAVTFLGVYRQGPDLASLWSWFAAGCGFGTPIDDVDAYILRDLRLPRLLVAIFGGASLAVAGAVMQASFRNPLASPDVIGTAAGAAFGGALAIVIGLSDLSVVNTPALALVCAIGVTWLVFVLAGANERFSVANLLLAGVALNTLVGALTAFVVTFRFDNYTASSRVLFFLMGGLEGRTWEHAAITSIGCLGFAALVWPRARELDLLTLRDDSAHSLGIDAARARRTLVWCACGLTATTVSNTGGIAFVGLVVPHLARLLVGPGHRVLLPTSALLGALLMVASDLGCRLLPPSLNLRLGVVTALLGAPYFLYLLARQRRGMAL